MLTDQESPASVKELLVRSDLRRSIAIEALSASEQKDLGQFFTPRVVAERIAGEVSLPSEGVIRILDPGAGSGMLSAAIAARLLSERPAVQISLTAVELSLTVQPTLRETLEDCRRTAQDLGTALDYEIISEDFVSWASARVHGTLELHETLPRFDLVIQNPPYKKLGRSASSRDHLNAVGLDVPNLYAAFLGLGAHLLDDGGQLVAITPRSFANGTYFKPFRKQFLAMLGVDRLQVFQQRDLLFADLSVLQENIILTGTRGRRPEKVVIVTSRGHNDPTLERLVSYEDIVRPADPEYFLHIPTDDHDDHTAGLINALPARLDDLKLKVSTGRVVDFRSKEALRREPSEGAVALIYPAHMQGSRVKWPIADFRKFNAIAEDESTQPLLMPTGHYVLVKRFSAKEEVRRVVACVFSPEDTPFDQIGFENHLNVFHVNGAGMDEDLARGLAAWLNSNVLDTHFRQFSGHTQVNATDLRNMHYPSTGQLRRIGKNIHLNAWPNQTDLDALVGLHAFGGVDIGERISHMDEKQELSVQQARQVLRLLNFDAERCNERSGMVLCALLGLLPGSPWAAVRNPMLRTVEIMDFLRQHYDRDYKPNTRETIRRQTLHQFVEAGLVEQNPDRPDRPINSPHWCYQVSDTAIALFRTSNTPEFEDRLADYLANLPGQLAAYAEARETHRIPVVLSSGLRLSLTAGGQNKLLVQIIDEFCSRFTPAGEVLYIGDAGNKFIYFDEAALRDLGFAFRKGGKMPDLIVHMKDENRIVFLEAASSHGPVDPLRKSELMALCAGSDANLSFVSCFETREAMKDNFLRFAWGTSVWSPDHPTHLIYVGEQHYLTSR